MSATVPKIEASYSNTGLSASLAATTVFTPSNTGLYRVSVYAVVQSGAGSIAGQVGFTDDYGAKDLSTNLSAFSTAPASVALTVKATAGNPITILWNLTGTATYDTYVVVESL